MRLSVSVVKASTRATTSFERLSCRSKSGKFALIFDLIEDYIEGLSTTYQCENEPNLPVSNLLRPLAHAPMTRQGKSRVSPKILLQL